MRYSNEAQKENIINLLSRHGFSYAYTKKDGTIVYVNENRYKVNVKAV